MDSRQQQAIDFLTENIEFFSAPFWNPYVFKKWAMENRNQITPLSDALFQALENDIEQFSEALIGKGNRDRSNSLLRGNQERIKSLLQANPRLVEVLCRFSTEENEIIHEWNKWYHLNPQIMPKHQDEKHQHQLIEKITTFEIRNKEKRQKLIAELQLRLIQTIEEKTEQYLQALSCDFIKAIQHSLPIKQLFENKYLIDSEKINYFLAEQTETFSHHARVGNFKHSFIEFARDITLEKIDPQISLDNNISSLAFKYHHANHLKSIIVKPDLTPEKKLQEAKESLDKPHIRDKLGAERGFWGWILGKLGLLKSRGKKLISFFDEKFKSAHINPPVKLTFPQGLEISEEKESFRHG